ncbi:patatin-like phospholipase family protein [Calderihabitans maritimus]|uniref:Patatin n=1 Tax=Calderihabitans maritimus TaxID=1246530 RepID=A0A1Z5HRN2_9FIRM|nr:patatin-like phospholipase family protein [Calderihabitans maritimus]GAW92186.1 patatin [Calderihabitans maritimus]
MKIGLALSGGGIRGAAHIGVLEILVQNNIKPDIIAGTSAGSIIGALYASGMSPQQIADILKDLKPRKLVDLFLPFLSFPLSYRMHRLGRWKLPSGLLKGKLVEKWLRENLGNQTFSQLKFPLAVISADINTGEMIVFTDRYLVPSRKSPDTVFITDTPVYEAVRASIAIPAVFAPKKISSRTLVDGAIVNNVPADVLRLLGADKVIAVDLSFIVRQKRPVQNAIEILLQSGDIMGQRISNYITSHYADITLYPNTGEVNLLDFAAIPQMIAIGRKVTLKRLPEIKEILSR